MDNKTQKLLAYVIIFVILVIYKQNVLDLYLGDSSSYGSRDMSSPVSSPIADLPSARGYSDRVTETTQAPGTATVNDTARPPSYEDLAAAGFIEVDTDTIHATISLRGGRIVNLRLKKFAETINVGSPALNLISQIAGVNFPLPLGIQTTASNDVNTLYSLQEPRATIATVSGHEVATFNLHGTLADGTSVVKSLEFYGSGYMFGVKATFPNVDTAYEWTWDRYISDNDPALSNSYALADFTWYDGKRALRETLKSATSTGSVYPNLEWMSLGDHYFMASLIAPPQQSSVESSSGLTGRFYRSGSLFCMRLSGSPSGIQIYAGPKNYSDLQGYGRGLHLNVNLGKTGFVSAPLLSVLHFIYSIFGNYGVAVVLLTIIVKILTYPLSHSSFKQMKAMQEISPEIKRIRENVQDTAQQQQELMALYKKRGVNPMGGCLPMFLQLPIFIGLYSALSLDVELRHAKFAFWIQDLSAKEALPFLGIDIPVMAILMIVAMLVQQWITPSTADATQKKIMMFMPILMGFMFMNLPAGLTLYFLTNSIISITQTQGLYKGNKASSGITMTLGASFAMFMIAFVMSKVG